MKNITKILIIIAIIMTAISVNAQQECAVVCHNGKLVKTIGGKATEGHLKHGDVLISTDCDYVITGNECDILSAPKFSFSKSYPFNLEYKVYDITGKELQTGLTSLEMKRNLPKTQVIILKVETYQPTLIILK